MGEDSAKRGPHHLSWLVGSLRLVLALSAYTGGQALGLRIGSLEVPAAVMNGSQVTLACRYDLQGDQLYSVKWYKNFVEFYRFQPADLGSQEAPQDNQQEWKQGFELDGINLNLAKSNATHVHLRLTSLASEGSYKCEVSAESPSFATVSQERQMKVYVLPKQKLSIVDNAGQQAPDSAGSPAKLSLVAASASQPAPIDQLASEPQNLVGVYNVNDVINLTCVAAPSRPAAQLTWYLNEAPVASSSKWLTASGPASGAPHDATHEARLTIAFRLQPSHLSAGLGSAHAGRPPAQTSAADSPVRLRCVGRLKLDYVSETSVAVAGGRNLAAAPARHAPAPLPTPASLEAPAPSEAGLQPVPASPSSSSPSQPLAASASQTSPFRWPPARAAQRPGAHAAGHRGGRPASAPGDTFLEPWVTGAPVDMFGAPSSGPDWASEEGAARPAALASLARPLAGRRTIWTSRQLRAQTEHIERLLELSRANQLEPPLIEARSLASTRGSSGANEPDEARPSGPAEQQRRRAQTAGARTDYQLNERVQFLCRPRVSLPPTGEPALKTIHQSWLINGKPVASSGRVNAYDGSRFYFNNSTTSAGAGPESETGSDTLALVHATAADPSRRRQEAERAPHWTPSAGGLAATHGHQPLGTPLELDFSASLIQLKELTLTCRTLVRQPLIEYESQLIVSTLATTGAQLGAANQSPASDRPRSHRQQQSNRYATGEPTGNARARNFYRQRQPSSSSSKSSSPEVALLCSLYALVAPLVATFLIRQQFVWW